MTRSFLGLLTVAGFLLGVGLTPARAADTGTITGTVTVTGQSTNADAIVYVEHAPGPFKPPAEPAVMDQKNLKFIPHVLPIVIGTTVKFKNSDSVAHNVFSPDHEKYNLGTFSNGESKDHAFNKCAKFPCAYVQLCMIHPEMEAYIVVLENPYFGVTDAAGHYTVKDVPSGKYTLVVWHPKAKGKLEAVNVEAGKSVTANFTLGR